MGYKTFVAGEEALASDVNAYLMGQAVARFPSVAARTSQLTAPVLNQLSMLDTKPGRIEFWNGSAWVDLELVVQGIHQTGTTDAGGTLSVTFPVAFAAAPSIVVQNRKVGVGLFLITPTANITAAGFLVQFLNTAGSVYASQAVDFNYIATGLRA